jgi:hypothetical protein
LLPLLDPLLPLLDPPLPLLDPPLPLLDPPLPLLDPLLPLLDPPLPLLDPLLPLLDPLLPLLDPLLPLLDPLLPLLDPLLPLLDPLLPLLDPPLPLLDPLLPLLAPPVDASGLVSSPRLQKARNRIEPSARCRTRHPWRKQFMVSPPDGRTKLRMMAATRRPSRHGASLAALPAGAEPPNTQPCLLMESLVGPFGSQTTLLCARAHLVAANRSGHSVLRRYAVPRREGWMRFALSHRGAHSPQSARVHAIAGGGARNDSPPCRALGRGDGAPEYVRRLLRNLGFRSPRALRQAQGRRTRGALDSAALRSGRTDPKSNCRQAP